MAPFWKLGRYKLAALVSKTNLRKSRDGALPSTSANFMITTLEFNYLNNEGHVSFFFGKKERISGWKSFVKYYEQLLKEIEERKILDSRQI